MNSTLFAITAVGAVLSLQCAADAGDQQATPASASNSPPPVSASDEIPRYAPAILRQPVPVDRATEDKLFADAARAAWAQINGTYQPSTGLTYALPTWPYPTAWDIASSLAAYYSARGLGFISDAEYRTRASRLLETMKKARLYQGMGYGRNYDAKTGELVGADQKPHANGTGYSAIDLGRLLVVLAIVAKHDSELADAARAVASRIDGKRVVKDGYMVGTEVNPKTGKPEEYQEGRLGYEQYSASGFSLWNMRPAGAMAARANMKRATVYGIPISADKRGLDRLTSEPFIMHGLELGWDADVREMAWQTLSAQAARFVTTGRMTMASEDALDQPPHYFYYYCVYCSGKPFVINVHSPGLNLDGPRWVSTKAAFAWHALLPSKYTWQALETVRPAFNPQSGWASGVLEGSRKSTGAYSLNTAAIILEAALYRKTGKPLMERSR